MDPLSAILVLGGGALAASSMEQASMLRATQQLRAHLGMVIRETDTGIDEVLPVQPPTSLWEVFNQIPSRRDPDWFSWDCDTETAWFPTSKDDFELTWGLSGPDLIARVRGAFRGEQPPVQISITAMESLVNSQLDAFVHHGAVVARCIVFAYKPEHLFENLRLHVGAAAADQFLSSLMAMAPGWDPSNQHQDAVVVHETRRIEGTDLAEVLRKTEAFYEQRFWQSEDQIKALFNQAKERS